MKAKTAKRELDMLHGAIWNKIPLFALPVAATAILERKILRHFFRIILEYSSDGAINVNMKNRIILIFLFKLKYSISHPRHILFKDFTILTQLLFNVIH